MYLINDFNKLYLKSNLPEIFTKKKDKIYLKIQNLQYHIQESLCYKIIIILWIFFFSLFKFIFHLDKDLFIKDFAESLAYENPIYVKILQSISTNCNIFNEKQMEYLIQFTDNVPYNDADIDYEFLNTLISIGRENNDYCVIIDENPINVGTVGVVFKGTMGKSRKEIIVKLMKKNIRNKIIDALNIGSYIINILQYLPYTRHLDLKNIYQENCILLIEQTDFLKEVNSINEFYRLNENINYIVIPKVYNIFTEKNNNIIVMDYIAGDKINNINKEDYKYFGNILNKFALKTILFDSKFHGDLHAGNMIFIKEKVDNQELYYDQENKDNQEKYIYKIGIIDYGIVGSITREEQNEFYKFIKILLNDNIYYKELAIHTLNNFVEPQEIIKSLKNNENTEILLKLENIFKYACEVEGNFTINGMYNINYTLSKYYLRLKRYFCKIQISFFICSNINNFLYKEEIFLEKLKIAGSDLFNLSLLSFD